MTNNIISLYAFNKRYEYQGNYVIDKVTNKIYFCPNDIGITKTIEDCKLNTCTECWREVIKNMYLKGIR
ncbi:MAG: hypothetical protein E6860_16065 [Clostridium sp.]|uniref:hypothetical protein n=1 Tax=Clostridium sp. TaxID=1506 RepID=UPI00242A6335|nr:MULTISPECIES: hypothetical protein [Clostridium]MDU1587052.1 hypothetical protein [Clostridium sp.]